jgi:proteasome lid subunit RPN8/RPN11
MTEKFISLTVQQLYSIHHFAQQEAPREACGLLAGTAGVVAMVIPVKNIASGNTRFQMDPRAQLRAMELIEIEKLEMLGIFHSHPKGDNQPSSSDIRESAYPVINVICGRAGRKWNSRGFWIENSSFVEIPIVYA